MRQTRFYRTLALLITLLIAAGADEPAWQAKFNEQYLLADSENAKLIRPPFAPERAAFHRKSHPGVGNHPGQYGFRQNTDGKLVQRRWSSDPGTVASALYMADIDRSDMEGVPEVLDLKVPGDWIVRQGASRKDLLADIQRELTQTTDGRIRVEPAQVEKEVVVARGKFALKPLANAPREPNSVHLFVATMDTQQGAGGGTANMAGFLRRIGDVIGQKVIDETEPRQGEVEWTNNNDDDKAGESEAGRDAMLKHVSEQTGLEFKVESRKVDVWRVIDTTGQAGGL